MRLRATGFVSHLLLPWCRRFTFLFVCLFVCFARGSLIVIGAGPPPSLKTKQNKQSNATWSSSSGNSRFHPPGARANAPFAFIYLRRCVQTHGRRAVAPRCRRRSRAPPRHVSLLSHVQKKNNCALTSAWRKQHDVTERHA